MELARHAVFMNLKRCAPAGVVSPAVFTPLQPDAPYLQAGKEGGIQKVKEKPRPLGRVVTDFTGLEKNQIKLPKCPVVAVSRVAGRAYVNPVRSRSRSALAASNGVNKRSDALLVLIFELQI